MLSYLDRIYLDYHLNVNFPQVETTYIKQKREITHLGISFHFKYDFLELE